MGSLNIEAIADLPSPLPTVSASPLILGPASSTLSSCHRHHASNTSLIFTDSPSLHRGVCTSPASALRRTTACATTCQVVGWILPRREDVSCGNDAQRITRSSGTSNSALLPNRFLPLPFRTKQSQHLFFFCSPFLHKATIWHHQFNDHDSWSEYLNLSQHNQASHGGTRKQPPINSLSWVIMQGRTRDVRIDFGIQYRTLNALNCCSRPGKCKGPGLPQKPKPAEIANTLYALCERKKKRTLLLPPPPTQQFTQTNETKRSPFVIAGAAAGLSVCLPVCLRDMPVLPNSQTVLIMRQSSTSFH